MAPARRLGLLTLRIDATGWRSNLIAMSLVNDKFRLPRPKSKQIEKR